MRDNEIALKSELRREGVSSDGRKRMVFGVVDSYGHGVGFYEILLKGGGDRVKLGEVTYYEGGPLVEKLAVKSLMDNGMRFIKFGPAVLAQSYQARRLEKWRARLSESYF